MNFDFLPIEISNALYKLDINKLNEIRLRENAPVKIIYDFNPCFLSKTGTTILKSQALTSSQNDLEQILLSVTDYSIYASNDTIIKGYVTSRDGIRIGIAGECVVENGKIVTLTKPNSLCIRIPHFVVDAGKKVYDLLLRDSLKNILIVSPPRQGKTTILKSLIKYFDNDENNDILVIDERGELIVPETSNVDFVRFSTKLFGFEYGVRSLSPTVVVTDELMSNEDYCFVDKAVSSGVKVVATVHANTVKDLESKKFFSSKLFDYFVILNSYGQAGRVERILDSNKNELPL